ncbi:MAG: hypothetical protein WCT31_00560 [Candidatus Micrarchaeia archaeon]
MSHKFGSPSNFFANRRNRFIGAAILAAGLMLWPADAQGKPPKQKNIPIVQMQAPMESEPKTGTKSEKQTPHTNGFAWEVHEGDEYEHGMNGNKDSMRIIAIANSGIIYEWGIKEMNGFAIPPRNRIFFSADIGTCYILPVSDYRMVFEKKDGKLIMNVRPPGEFGEMDTNMPFCSTPIPMSTMGIGSGMPQLPWVTPVPFGTYPLTNSANQFGTLPVTAREMLLLPPEQDYVPPVLMIKRPNPNQQR